MSSDRARSFDKLTYHDPRQVLLAYREIEEKIALSDLPRSVKELRTQELKLSREIRSAAIFFYGISLRMQQHFAFTAHEAQDHDFVMRWPSDDHMHYAPVQLKEVPPAHLNPNATVQGIVDKLRAKYVDARDLAVIIHVNQNGEFDPRTLQTEGLGLASLWMFHACAPHSAEWTLWGNFLETPLLSSTFKYPEP